MARGKELLQQLETLKEQREFSAAIPGKAEEALVRNLKIGQGNCFCIDCSIQNSSQSSGVTSIKSCQSTFRETPRSQGLETTVCLPSPFTREAAPCVSSAHLCPPRPAHSYRTMEEGRKRNRNVLVLQSSSDLSLLYRNQGHDFYKEELRIAETNL